MNQVIQQLRRKWSDGEEKSVVGMKKDSIVRVQKTLDEFIVGKIDEGDTEVSGREGSGNLCGRRHGRVLQWLYDLKDK